MDLSKTALWVVAKVVARAVVIKVLTSVLERAFKAEDLVVVVDKDSVAVVKDSAVVVVKAVKVALEVRVSEALVVVLVLKTE